MSSIVSISLALMLRSSELMYMELPHGKQHGGTRDQ